MYYLYSIILFNSTQDILLFKSYFKFIFVVILFWVVQSSINTLENNLCWPTLLLRSDKIGHVQGGMAVDCVGPL